ncbi:hypothetical protein [Flavisphingomonas formosensis]|uniref:hypothetical protein n=1 Tax=Flavisphingomonas formosensis TaxID=861534 RepID=UPI0012F96CDB|nr:hypothetical protein [Sphingomonas formosensis]
MTKIVGIDGMTVDALNAELERGGRFVHYQYCISILVMSFKRSSNIYFLRADEKHWQTATLFSVISLLLGWWGIPWGPIWTVGTTISNLSGGRDVTPEVLQHLSG